MAASPLEPKLTRLYEIVGKVSSVIDLKWLLGLICGGIVETLGYRMAWIGLVDPSSFEVRPLAQAGFEKGYLKSIKVRYDESPLGRGPTGTAIRTGKPVIQSRIDSDPNYAPWREEALKRGYRSSAAIPLRVDHQALGALNVYSQEAEAFDLDEIQRLQSYADQASFTIKKALATEGARIEVIEERAPRYKLERSESYMVLEEEPKRAFEIFEEHLLHGWRGLCITRQHPKQVRERYNLENAQVFWLTDLKAENTVNDLLEISLLIGGFLNSNESAIALLDGLEYLVSRYGFEATYHFIQNKRSQTAATESILLITVHPKAFPEQELALLERELKPLL